IGMKVVPTVSEYFAIKKAIVIAKESGKTVRDIQTSFDKQASASYIDSISGKDLEIIRDGENFEVSFAYEKKISLMGPLSLVIDYRGGTARKSSGSKID
ncbi:MAG: hypothetical protein K0S28_2294, partial [Paucimonas sp.]|nr:hypothetical protein [Paucimonas sp.]